MLTSHNFVNFEFEDNFIVWRWSRYVWKEEDERNCNAEFHDILLLTYYRIGYIDEGEMKRKCSRRL